MNLKEAFRYQNRLLGLMSEAQGILSWDKNVTKVENTALRHKVNPEAEDETTLETPETEYADQITQVAAFLMYLLRQREALSHAIRQAKQTWTLTKRSASTPSARSWQAFSATWDSSAARRH